MKVSKSFKEIECVQVHYSRHGVDGATVSLSPATVTLPSSCDSKDDSGVAIKFNRGGQARRDLRLTIDSARALSLALYEFIKEYDKQ
jgi:hypothetical protein